MSQNKNLLTVLLVFLPLLVAAYVVMLYLKGFAMSEPFINSWALVYLMLGVMWIDLDSRSRPDVYRPFEYGFLVVIYWIPYVPYYLYRTRGTKGLVYFAAFVGLYVLADLAPWIVYWVVGR